MLNEIIVCINVCIIIIIFIFILIKLNLNFNSFDAKMKETMKEGMKGGVTSNPNFNNPVSLINNSNNLDVKQVTNSYLNSGSDNEFSGNPTKFSPNGTNKNNANDEIGTSFTQIEKERSRNTIDFNLFNDLTFRDIIVYDNDINGRLGLDKCLDNKVGTCVPYGSFTGIAYYYPPTYGDTSYGDAITAGLTPKEEQQPLTGSMVFPNLR